MEVHSPVYSFYYLDGGMKVVEQRHECSDYSSVFRQPADYSPASMSKNNLSSYQYHVTKELYSTLQGLPSGLAKADDALLVHRIIDAIKAKSSDRSHC